MTTSLWRHDVIAWAVQVALIVGASAALSHFWRGHHPRAALAWWRILLAACLLLPICQAWTLAPSALPRFTPLTADTAISGLARLSESEPAPAASAAAWSWLARSAPWTIDALLLTVLAIGVAVRVTWLIVGAWTLHRLRRAASPIEPLPRVWAEAQARLGVRARLFVSEGVDGPITFGVIRPVIIVPASLPAMPEHVQQAIAVHELLHVQRRDWIDTIAEEIVRAACWFHPAVWWLIGRIRVSREQVVDRAAIALTDSRDHYIDALLAVARSRLPRVLVPAAPFLRRTALKERVACILQETTMTTRRLIATLTASAAVLTLTAAMATRTFPLKAEEPRPKTPPAGARTATDASAGPVQIVRGGEHLLHGMTPEYPKRAIEKRLEGEVVLDVTLDERGEVSDARVVSGPEEFRRAALESVLHWHYAPEALRSTAVQVELRFQVPTEIERESRMGYALEKVEKDMKDGASPAQRHEHVLVEIESALQGTDLTDGQREELKKKAAEARTRLAEIRARAGQGEPAGDRRLVRVWTERVPRETAAELMAQAGISVGDQITEETYKRIRNVATTLDEHLRVVLRPAEGGGLMLVLLAP